MTIGFFLEALLIGLALAMDCFTVGITCGLQRTIKLPRAILMALCFGVFQGGMPLIGSLIGYVFKGSVISFAHWIAFTLLFIIGLKMFMEGRSYSLKNHTFDVSSFKVILLLSLATSIDAFVTGIGFGMQYNDVQVAVLTLVIIAVTFVMTLIGWKSGEKLKFVKPPFALIIGGLILIGIGVKNLLAFYFS